MFSFLRETLQRKRQHFSLEEYRIERSSGPRFEGHVCYPPAVSPRAGYQISLTSVYLSVNKQENTFPHRLVARTWNYVMKGSVSITCLQLTVVCGSLSHVLFSGTNAQGRGRLGNMTPLFTSAVQHKAAAAKCTLPSFPFQELKCLNLFSL